MNPQILSTYGVDLLTPESAISHQFKVTDKAVLVSASGLRAGDKIILAEILSSKQPMCKGPQAHLPSNCGCTQILFKDMADPNAPIPTYKTNNRMVVDVPGTYYLVYWGNNELGVEIYKRELTHTPADAKSARGTCCGC